MAGADDRPIRPVPPGLADAWTRPLSEFATLPAAEIEASLRERHRIYSLLTMASPRDTAPRLATRNVVRGALVGPPVPAEVVVFLDAVRPAHIGAVADDALADREGDATSEDPRGDEDHDCQATADGRPDVAAEDQCGHGSCRSDRETATERVIKIDI